MTAPPQRVDPRSYRLDRLFFFRIWRLVQPYWFRPHAIGSWLALGFMSGMAALYGIAGAYSSYLTKDQTDALVNRHTAVFWHLLWLNTAYLAARYGSSRISDLVASKLNLNWRRWLTTFLIDKYLAQRTYYEIALDRQIDNPDQRIQEEVAPFCETMSAVPGRVVATLADMTIQGFILITLSPVLTWVVIVFAVLKTVGMLFLYRPTIKQNYDVTVAEADLRYGILHVRDHAETVAFYRGEYAERTHVLARLSTVVQKNLAKIVYGIWMNVAEDGMYVLWTLLPLIFLAPLFLHHQIEYGTIAQGAASAAALLSSLSVFMRFIPNLSEAVPGVVRLAEIQEKCDQLASLSTDPSVPRIRLLEGEKISLTGVSLSTPGGEHRLVQNITLQIERGVHVAIVGQTGVGKSSLLRAMAGLWTRGSGCIVMPPPDKALFLPQKPYMILASLREQLLYPKRRADVTENELLAVLELMRLAHLCKKPGDLEAIADWGRILSLGEQQRIAFARILLNRPEYVFLDEATSAVDNETECRLYRLLENTGATYVSVGHRLSILPFHRRILTLKPGGLWELSINDLRSTA